MTESPLPACRLCIVCLTAMLLLATAACAEAGTESLQGSATFGATNGPLKSVTVDSMLIAVHRVPLEQIYGRHWQTKRITYDIRFFDGRVYIGHGSTNSPVGTKVIFFDPAEQAFNVERDARGQDVEIPEEIIDRFRVLEGALYVNSRDPVRGGTHFIRRNDRGDWTSRVIAPMAHNYDIHLFRGTYLISHPSHRGDFPGILVSRTGNSFASLDGSAVHDGPYTPYFEFIEVGDQLVATTIGSRSTTIDGVRVTSGQPWMVRFDFSDDVTVEALAQDPDDLVDGLIDEAMSPAQLRRAVRLGDATFAINAASQIVRLEEGSAGMIEASLLPVGLDEGAYIADLATGEDGRLLALIVRRMADNVSEMEIRSMEDSGAWSLIVSMEVDGTPTALEQGFDALYVGGHDGLFIEAKYGASINR